MKIAFVLSAKYPTAKAYGITTRKSAEALKALGHDVVIFCTESEYSDEDFLSSGINVVGLHENRFYLLLRKYLLGNTRFYNKAIFKFLTRRIISNHRNVSEMKGYDLIWIRDVSVSLIISEKLNKISHVLELHSTPDINKLIKIQRSLGGKLVLAPINEHLMHSIDSPKLICKKILAPMSIDLKLLETKVGIADYIKSIKQKASAGNLKLGYVGKFSPIGYSKGIQDLIELGKLLPSHLMGWEIVIAGGLQSEIENLNWSFVDSMQQNNNIKLLGHFTHTKAIELMRNIDIHVIPAPQSSKYVGTPLKLREIIALGKIVIAADCQVLRNCFPGKYQPYWYEPQDATSLLVAIQTAIADPEKLRNITNGVKEVSQFTWDSRVKLILNCIHLE